MSGRPSRKSAEIGIFRPFSAFFALFRRVPRAPGKSRKQRKKAFFLRHPRISLNPHLLNPHLRHSKQGRGCRLYSGAFEESRYRRYHTRLDRKWRNRRALRGGRTERGRRKGGGQGKGGEKGGMKRRARKRARMGPIWSGKSEWGLSKWGLKVLVHHCPRLPTNVVMLRRGQKGHKVHNCRRLCADCREWP